MKAIITGASSGIGRECAILLAKKGYDLVLAARRAERLNELAGKLARRYGIRAEAYPVDLSEPEAVIAFAEHCMAEPVEILVNNAGFGKVGDFTFTALADEFGMIQTNITAVHILMKYFIRTQKHGYILNLSSIAGHLPGPGLATYAATKAYVLSLSRAVGYELKEAGIPISVTAYCPGPVHTEFFKVAGADNELPSVSAKRCARVGLRGMFAKRPVAFSDLRTSLLQKGIRLLPCHIALAIDYRAQKAKLPKEK